MNSVEFFRSMNLVDLQETINAWCKANDKDPISISLSKCDLRYVAAVVVQESFYE